VQAGKSYQCKKIEYFSYHRARRIDAEPIITRNKSYDYWLFLFCDRKTNRHFLYIKWNSGKYTIIFIDMAVSGDIAMFLFHIFNSIPLLKKSLFHITEFCDHKDEHTNHYSYLNNSYYQTPMRFYVCMGVCCNSPLLGRKGVSYDEVF
jgi:hypothetical protein